MSASYNRVILLGAAGKDAELRTTTSGQKVADFTLATSRSWDGKSGDRQIKTEWHNIVTWGKLAEIAEKYVKKDKMIHLEGRIETRNWKDQDGKDRYKTEIIADSLTFVGRRNKEDGQ